MPTLGNALDFAKYEARNLRGHQLGAAPSSPVTGQLYYNTADNTLYWWNGTVWVSASGGAPSGAAGGDLSGTYPNPQIAAGAILNADINAAAAIALSKLAVDPLARANHTGTQLAATISDFTTARDLQRLDQHVAPTAQVNLNNQKIANLADPTQDQDATNKRYVDNAVQGLDAKKSVIAASTGNLTLSGTQTIDGRAVVANDRVLVKDQGGTASNPANGIYDVKAGAWTRSADMDSADEFQNAYVWVEEGTVNKDTGWVCTNDITSTTLDVSNIAWVQFASAGASIAGAGLTKTGNTLDVGAAAGITVAADTVGVATGGVTNAMLAGAIDATTKLTGAVPVANGGTSQTTAKAARETGLAAAGYYTTATHGAGTTITITQATHLLRASRGLIVQVQDEAVAGGTPGSVVLPDIVVAATGDVTITFGAAVSANTYRITIIG